jgi:hypothetical protein
LAGSGRCGAGLQAAAELGEVGLVTNAKARGDVVVNQGRPAARWLCAAVERTSGDSAGAWWPGEPGAMRVVGAACCSEPCRASWSEAGGGNLWWSAAIAGRPADRCRWWREGEVEAGGSATSNKPVVPHMTNLLELFFANEHGAHQICTKLDEFEGKNMGKRRSAPVTTSL